MPVSDPGRSRFDRDAFQANQDAFDSLGPHLSEHALQTLAREVIGRLSGRAETPPRDGSQARADEVATMLAHLIEGSADAAADHVEELLAKGYTLEEVYLLHISSAARALGTMWDEDRLSFSEVTLATSRIYGLLRALRGRAPARVVGERRAHAVFAAVPGEEHTLGVTMAADMFRRRGWEIDLLVAMDHDALIFGIERSDALLVGLSASGIVSADPLARLVVAVRAARPEAYVLIAGQIVREAPDAVRLMGADALASDAVNAEHKLRLLAEIASPA